MSEPVGQETHRKRSEQQVELPRSHVHWQSADKQRSDLNKKGTKEKSSSVSMKPFKSFSTAFHCSIAAPGMVASLYLSPLLCDTPGQSHLSRTNLPSRSHPAHRPWKKANTSTNPLLLRLPLFHYRTACSRLYQKRPRCRKRRNRAAFDTRLLRTLTRRLPFWGRSYISI